ncbi:hypothetical protein [Vagococcus fluvialis]|uniref:hypothetical protein n=1 Tax=Vagococcus fluvialis TaxID=2738 RepID=UPI001D0B66EB|nr:hypothetical protein [Vagococcus fluvialis]UDM72758.1 hypothetical protein K5L00_14485 [Vagococcus fluvialis]UDM78314.1 hypothetical protein K5K98_14690 [Vagococcus fluvialis]UDM84033.1 hypothetical protein K5K96_14510 [Vagococcus fluvialis]
MIYSKEYPLKNRNQYVRLLVKILTKKYDVIQSRISLKIGMNPNYFRDFSSARKDLNEENIDKIESYLIDLYEGIFMFEIPQEKEEFDSFMENLDDSTIYSEYVLN